MQVKRFFAFADRYFIRRALPHGIVSWRYLLPHPPPKVLIHRRLWFMGRDPRIPLPLYLIIEVLLWLRWVAFGCWWNSLRTVRRRGRDVRQGEGIAMAVQLMRVLALSLCHCAPPGEIYAFALYRPGAKETVWEYVFVHEISAFHSWRNAGLVGSRDSSALLQDKFRLAELLSSNGIPMAPLLELAPRGAPFDPTPFLRSSARLFCKPRHGSAGRDAFVIEGGGNGEYPAIFAVISGLKGKPATAASLRTAMGRDDFLIQPLMENHPRFAALSPAGDAITLRVITERHSSGIRCFCPTLEIPGGTGAEAVGHIILPVDLPSGRVTRFPEDRLPHRARARHDAVLASLGECIVPFWDEIKESAMAAHGFFPGLHAIAWDYVVTATGPLMLEGNGGWGATTPQVLHGGMLRNDKRED